MSAGLRGGVLFAGAEASLAAGVLAEAIIDRRKKKDQMKTKASKSSTKRNRKMDEVSATKKPATIIKLPLTLTDEEQIVAGVLRESARTKFPLLGNPALKRSFAPFVTAAVRYACKEGPISSALEHVSEARAALAEHALHHNHAEFVEPKTSDWFGVLKANAAAVLKAYSAPFDSRDGDANRVDQGGETIAERPKSEALRDAPGADADSAEPTCAAAVVLPLVAPDADSSAGNVASSDLPVEAASATALPAAYPLVLAALPRAPEPDAAPNVTEFSPLSGEDAESDDPASALTTPPLALGAPPADGEHGVHESVEAGHAAGKADAAAESSFAVSPAEGAPGEFPEATSSASAESPELALAASAKPELSPAETWTWTKPLGLAEAHGPEFPIGALSKMHRRYVEELAEQVQVAVGAPAVATLVAFGAAVSKSAFVSLPGRGTQPLNLWAGLISPPADGKTPLLEEIRKPFDLVQAELRAAAREKAAELATERSVLQRQIRKLDAELAACTDPAEEAALKTRAIALRQKLDAKLITIPTLTTGDSTQAGLAAVLEENQGRIWLLTDEGDQIFSRIQKNSKRGEANVDVMLQAFSGATISCRVKNKETRAENAALSLLAMIQPAPFGRVMGVQAFHSKGLMSRFAMCLPKSLKGARKQSRKGLSAEAVEEYSATIRTLLARSTDSPTALTLSEEAFESFASWAASIEEEISRADASPFLAWLGKLRGLTARLAGVLHFTSEPGGAIVETIISKETVERAIEIARYFMEHARVAYAHSAEAALDEDPRRVLKWIVNGRREVFTFSEAVGAFSNRLNAASVAASIERLVVAGYLREKDEPRNSSGRRTSSGRPRKPTYIVNPYLFTAD